MTLPTLSFALKLAVTTAFCWVLLPTSWASAVDEVFAAEKSRGQALIQGDVVLLNNLLSSELIYIHSTGKRETKQDVMKGLESKQVAYERFDVSNLSARAATQEVVILSGSIDQRKLARGKWAEVKLLFHGAWRLEEGRWKLFSLQTALPPAVESR